MYSESFDLLAIPVESLFHTIRENIHNISICFAKNLINDDSKKGYLVVHWTSVYTDRDTDVSHLGSYIRMKLKCDN